MKTATDIAWSHSAVKSYETCPLRYYAEKVTKEVPFDNNAPALVRGRRVHEALEHRIGSSVPLPQDLAALEPYAQWVHGMRATYDTVQVERQMTVTATLRQTTWFGKDAWFRCAADVMAVNRASGEAKVVDWKTGRNYGDDGQGRLNALATMLVEPTVNVVTVDFVYLDQKGEARSDTYHRSAMADYLRPALETLSRIAQSHNDNTWPAKPGVGCKFCKVARCAHYKGA